MYAVISLCHKVLSPFRLVNNFLHSVWVILVKQIVTSLFIRCQVALCAAPQLVT